MASAFSLQPPCQPASSHILFCYRLALELLLPEGVSSAVHLRKRGNKTSPLAGAIQQWGRWVHKWWSHRWHRGQKVDMPLKQGKWPRWPERFRKKVASEWVLNLLPGVSVPCIPEKEAVALPSMQLWSLYPGAVPHGTQMCACWEPEAGGWGHPEDPDGLDWAVWFTLYREGSTPESF